MKRITKILVLALAFIMLFGTISSFASEPYDTYTYSIDGKPMASPPAYSAMEDFEVELGGLDEYYSLEPVEISDIRIEEYIEENKD